MCNFEFLGSDECACEDDFDMGDMVNFPAGTTNPVLDTLFKILNPTLNFAHKECLLKFGDLYDDDLS